MKVTIDYKFTGLYYEATAIDDHGRTMYIGKLDPGVWYYSFQGVQIDLERLVTKHLDFHEVVRFEEAKDAVLQGYMDWIADMKAIQQEADQVPEGF